MGFLPKYLGMGKLCAYRLPTGMSASNGMGQTFSEELAVLA
jgi:hypothetical protein